MYSFLFYAILFCSPLLPHAFMHTSCPLLLLQGTDVPSYRAGGMVLQQAPNDDVYAFGLSDGDGHMLQ